MCLVFGGLSSADAGIVEAEGDLCTRLFCRKRTAAGVEPRRVVSRVMPPRHVPEPKAEAKTEPDRWTPTQRLLQRDIDQQRQRRAVLERDIAAMDLVVFSLEARYLQFTGTPRVAATAHRPLSMASSQPPQQPAAAPGPQLLEKQAPAVRARDSKSSRLGPACPRIQGGLHLGAMQLGDVPCPVSTEPVPALAKVSQFSAHHERLFTLSNHTALATNWRNGCLDV